MRGTLTAVGVRIEGNYGLLVQWAGACVLVHPVQGAATGLRFSFGCGGIPTSLDLGLPVAGVVNCVPAETAPTGLRRVSLLASAVTGRAEEGVTVHNQRLATAQAPLALARPAVSATLARRSPPSIG